MRIIARGKKFTFVSEQIALQSSLWLNQDSGVSTVRRPEHKYYLKTVTSGSHASKIMFSWTGWSSVPDS